MVAVKEVTEELIWKDISHESYRTYTFWKDGKFVKVKINHPIKLNVSDSGGHRILDDKNIAHYIPSGWVHLYWETDDNTAIRF